MNNRNQPITAVLVGAGERGREAYGSWILKNPKKAKIVAVAELKDARRNEFARDHVIPPERVFSDWKELLTREKMADACLVCTQDRMHTEPAIAAMEAGYDVLLEKPMATSEEECLFLVETSEKLGRELRICHVMRYTGFFSRIKNLINDGHIGRLIHLNHSENVTYWHFAHGYVRGNWRRADDSSPVILAKTCHDLDMIYWLVESRAADIQSFGKLSHFTGENAPDGAPERCVDGCPAADTCLYYAPKMYVTGENLIRITARSRNPLVRLIGDTAIKRPGIIRFLGNFYSPLKTLADWDMWPATVITDNCTRDEKWDAMRDGPYGRCVYRCDNDVPDHQSVNIQFENGITATMAMEGHSFLDGRWIRIDGTEGTIMGEFTYAGERLAWYDHATLTEHILWESDISFTQHGGGDQLLMESFVSDLIRKKQGQEKAESLTGARASLESHLMAFAAERSRLENRVVPMTELRSG